MDAAELTFPENRKWHLQAPPLSALFTLKRNYSLQVVLELCRAEPMADAETIEVHLERIRALVSTWAAQVGLPFCEQRSAICSCFP